MFKSIRNLVSGKKQKTDAAPAADEPVKTTLYTSLNTKGFGTLQNHIALSPMTRARATEDGIVGDMQVEYYSQRASCGLLMTEGTFVSEEARGWWKAPGIYNEEQTKAWKVVVEKVKQNNPEAKFILQLWHTGRAGHSDFQPDEKPPLAPSPIAIIGEGVHVPNQAEKKPHEVPREMTKEDIERTVEDFGKAAKNAKEAGFDGVEIHGANGYIIDTFIQSFSNQRTDEFGGSIENRLKFLELIIDRVAKEYPVEKISVRFTPNGVYNGMGSEDNPAQFDAAIKLAAQKKLGIIHVCDGLAFGFHQKAEEYKLGRAMNIIKDVQADLAEGERSLLMANCGYTKETAEEAIESGTGNLVSFGRPYITNPDLVERFKQGKELNPGNGIDGWYGDIDGVPGKGYTDWPKAT